ncbi:transposase [Mesorhizobium sp. ORM16]|uniref:transposase n=1 Tax=Mesorhizobium sp. ORM16 TaxID=3376989 RepID=UPI0038577C18
MTLPGLDITVAASVAAAIGDIRRFGDPQRLVAYLGLNPSGSPVRGRPITGASRSGLPGAILFADPSTLREWRSR